MYLRILNCPCELRKQVRVCKYIDTIDYNYNCLQYIVHIAGVYIRFLCKVFQQIILQQPREAMSLSLLNMDSCKDHSSNTKQITETIFKNDHI